MAGQPVPSVNRAVHYTAYGTPGGEFPAGICRAATITEVDDPGNPDSAVGICVMNPTGLFFMRHCRHDEEKAPGTWHWAEYVPARDLASGK